jgi:hypothetical protein
MKGHFFGIAALRGAQDTQMVFAGIINRSGTRLAENAM